jgi:hypothetical protein
MCVPRRSGAFGLGTSRKRVSVRRRGEPRTLYLAEHRSEAGYVELANDPNRLFVVSAGSLSGLGPTLLELRDKRLLRVATSAGDELTVHARGVLGVHAKKSESGWTLISPANAPADAEKIRRVLDDLALARASAFEDTPEPREKYGLASPEVEVLVRAGDVEERLGLAQADARTWLERAGDPVILEANERVISNLPREFFDYREKRVLTLDVEQVRALEIDFPREQKKHRLKREGETWKADRRGWSCSLSRSRICAYLRSMRRASRRRSLDRAQVGLDRAAVVRAYDRSGKAARRARRRSRSWRLRSAALSSQSPLVWRVTNDIGRELPLSPEAFTNLLVKSSPAAAPPEALPEEEPPAATSP